MKILLLANQPEQTIRLKMFQGTLKELGYEVTVPKFGTRNWIKIEGLAKSLIKKEQPDVVHVFNVPDVIYRSLPKLKGSYFNKMVYDYRTPWGIDLQMRIGPLGRILGERFEKKLISSSDAITTVNAPLEEKVLSYEEAEGKITFVIPNYPARSFIQPTEDEESNDEAMIFVGRISKHEGIDNLLRITENFPHEKIWIVGGGPFAWWYLLKKRDNVKYWGWQPHDRVPSLVRRAKLCLVTMSETVLTPYATDRSVWKLSEYLNLGKLVIASGITKEEDRKNLVVVGSLQLEEAIRENLDRQPEKLKAEDYRFWDLSKETIRTLYEGIS